MDAVRTGVSVLPSRYRRHASVKPPRSGRHAYTVEVTPTLPRPQTGDRKADIQAYTQILNDRLCDHIRRYPEQWVWMHRRWKTRPAGEAPEKHPAPKPEEPYHAQRLVDRWLSRWAGSLSWERIDRWAARLARWRGLLSWKRRRRGWPPRWNACFASIPVHGIGIIKADDAKLRLVVEERGFQLRRSA
ncbi:MAG: hypothetical protein P9L99_17585 [Candidatus Lernaella stagnicola]|nr:hypothetical protein [Candidatus Lernaella stagnicola]